MPGHRTGENTRVMLSYLHLQKPVFPEQKQPGHEPGSVSHPESIYWIDARGNAHLMLRTSLPFKLKTSSAALQEKKMDPEPDFGADSYKGSGKLKGKVSWRTCKQISSTLGMPAVVHA